MTMAPQIPMGMVVAKLPTGNARMENMMMMTLQSLKCAAYVEEVLDLIILEPSTSSSNTRLTLTYLQQILSQWVASF